MKPFPHKPNDYYCICGVCHTSRTMTAQQMQDWFWANYETLMAVKDNSTPDN